MGEIEAGFNEAFRDFNVDGVAGSGLAEVDKARARALGVMIEFAVGAAQSGLEIVGTVAQRDAFWAIVDNQGKLVYVNNNNGSASDPDNGVYELVAGVPRLAEGFSNGLAAAVQPLIAAGLAEIEAIEGRVNATAGEIEGLAGGLAAISGKFRIFSFGNWNLGVFDRLFKVAGGWDRDGVLRSGRAIFGRASADTVETGAVVVSRSFSFGSASLRMLNALDATWVGGIDKFGRVTAMVRKSTGDFETGRIKTARLVGVSTINGIPIDSLGGGSVAPAKFSSVVEVWIVNGQSLSLGALGTPPLTMTAVGAALRWATNAYNSWAPLMEPCSPATIPGGSVETPSSGLAAMLQQLIADENGLSAGAPGHAYQPFLMNPGVAGTAIDGLKKGSAPWNAMAAQLATLRTLAAAENKTICVRGEIWMQGQEDYGLGTPTATYKAALIQRRTDLDELVKGIFPGNPDMTIVLSQPASHKFYQNANEVAGTRPNAIYAKDANIAVAMYELARDEPHFTLSLAEYVGDYLSDKVHCPNYTYRLFGGYHGRACKRGFIDDPDDIKSIFLRPIGFKVQGKVIEIEFAVPRPPLVIDSALCTLVDGRGFTLRNASGIDVGALAVDVIEPTKVRIVSPVDVTAGFQLRHAIDGALLTAGRGDGPRSNLRDSQGDDITFDTLGSGIAALHNMPPIFTHTF